jgi:hypothetical protein
MSDHSRYACNYELNEDGTAKPRPFPDAIRSLADLAQRQEAEAAWNAASRLFRLIDQWRAWFHELKATRDAHPGFALRLKWAVQTDARILILLGLNEIPGDEILKSFPCAPSGRLDPPWQEDQEWLEQTRSRLVNLYKMQGQLSDLLRLLETAPGVVVGHQADPGLRRAVSASGNENEPSPVRLTDRQEMILAAVVELETSEKRRNRGRAVAKQADFDYDSRLKTDLSVIRKLGFLDNDGAGYFRTGKPYP